MPSLPLPTRFAPAERAAEGELQRQAAQWQQNQALVLLANAVPDGILILNQYRQVVFANQAFLDIIDRPSADSVLGQRPGEILHCVHADIEPGGCGTSLLCQHCNAARAILNSLDGNQDVEEVLLERRHGLPPLNLRIWTTPLHNNGEDYTIFAIKDVHLEQENLTLMQSLQTLSITDPLTGLFNRRHLYHEAEREVERAQRYQHPLAVFMIDIDHFKQVNDTRGHEAGDRVLSALANVMRASLRHSDLLARHGGEEFAVLLPEITAEKAQAAAQRLLADVEAMQIPFRGMNLQTTISIGVSGIMPGESLSFEALLKQADDALYQAKQEGRNRVVMA
jgi:diguanylate cyclase (GGDEF)-like protein